MISSFWMWLTVISLGLNFLDVLLLLFFKIMFVLFLLVLLVLAKLFVVVAVFVLRVLFFLLLILCDMILLGYNIFQSLELVVWLTWCWSWAYGVNKFISTHLYCLKLIIIRLGQNGILQLLEIHCLNRFHQLILSFQYWIHLD